MNSLVQLSGMPLPSRSLTLPEAISQESSASLPLQSAPSPEARSQESIVPFWSQSAAAPVAISQLSRMMFPLQSLLAGIPAYLSPSRIPPFAHCVALTVPDATMLTRSVPLKARALNAATVNDFTAWSGVVGQSLPSVTK